jgi:hypothetical protein
MAATSEYVRQTPDQMAQTAERAFASRHLELKAQALD